MQHTLNTDKIQLLLEKNMYSDDYKPGCLGNTQEIINQKKGCLKEDGRMCNQGISKRE